jgi:hypothetical protein
MMHRLVIAVQTDTSRGGDYRPFCFRSYHCLDDNDAFAEELDINPSIDDVCRAVSASPEHFNAARIPGLKTKKFRDGAKQLPNPAMVVIKEIEAEHRSQALEAASFVSIGTGKPSRTIKLSGTAPDSLKSRYSVDQKVFQASRAQRFQYERFDGPEVFNDIDPASWQDDFPGNATIDRIHKATRNWCWQTDNHNRIVNIAKALVRRRKARAVTKDWDLFAGIHYTCLACKPESPPPFRNKDHFVDHLQADHLAPAPDAHYFEEVQQIVRDWSILSVQ